MKDIVVPLREDIKYALANFVFREALKNPSHGKITLRDIDIEILGAEPVKKTTLYIYSTKKH